MFKKMNNRLKKVEKLQKRTHNIALWWFILACYNLMLNLYLISLFI